MKEFNEIETNIDYEDPRMVLSISVDRGDYEIFERACYHNRDKPTEILREFMEAYAYADRKSELEERQLEHFIEKGIDNKLITLFNKLCSIENKIDSLSIKKIKMEAKNNGTE